MKHTRCPRCRSGNLKRFGFTHTVSRGKEQRWQCLDCFHTFTEGAKNRVKAEVKK